MRTLLRKGIVKGKKKPIEGTGYVPWNALVEDLTSYASQFSSWIPAIR